MHVASPFLNTGTTLVVVELMYENNRPENNGPVGFRYEHNRPSNNGGRGLEQWASWFEISTQ